MRMGRIGTNQEGDDKPKDRVFEDQARRGPQKSHRTVKSKSITSNAFPPQKSRSTFPPPPFCRFPHRVLQGRQREGLLHLCGSPDPFFMQQNEPFLP